MAFLFALLYLVSQAILGLISIRFAGKVLTTSDLKIWVLLVGMLPYAALFDFGVSTTLVRELSFRLHPGAKTQSEELSTVVHTLGRTSLIGSLGICFVALAVCAALGRSMFAFASYGVVLAFRILANVAMALVIAERGVAWERAIRLFANALFLVAVLAMLRWSWGIYSLHFATLLMAMFIICSGAACSPTLFRSMFIGRWDKKFFRETYPHLRNWTLTSVPSLFVFNFTIYSITPFVSSIEVITYSILHQILFGILSISTIPTTVASPRWSQLFAMGDYQRLRRDVTRTCRAANAIATIGTTIFVLLYHAILPVFSSKLAPVPALAVLAFGLLITTEAFQASLTAACMSRNYTNFIVITVIAGVVSVSLSSLGAWKFGLVGAIIGVLIAQTTTCNTVNILTAKKLFQLSVRSILVPITESLFFLGIACLFSSLYPITGFSHFSLLALTVALTLVVSYTALNAKHLFALLRSSVA